MNEYSCKRLFKDMCFHLGKGLILREPIPLLGYRVGMYFKKNIKLFSKVITIYIPISNV